MANAFATNYGYRKHRGFLSNDAVLTNYQKWITGYDDGSDADGTIDLNSHVRSDFNDFRVARFASGSNTFVDEWKEEGLLSSGVSCPKAFEIPEVYSSLATEDYSATETDLDVNDASGFAANDWVVVSDDNTPAGELCQIDSISTNTITLTAGLSGAYTTANNAKIVLAYYVYYGYASESDNSSIADTFIKGDDFERGNDGDAIGGDWDEGTANVDISTEQAFGGTRAAKFIGQAASKYFRMLHTAGANYAIRFRAYKEDASDLIINQGDGTNRINVWLQPDEDIEYYDTAFRDTGTNVTADAWQLIELNDIDFSGSQNYDIWHEGSEIQADASMHTNAYTANEIRFRDSSAGVGQDFWIDDFIIRQWVSGEITGCAFGSEEHIYWGQTKTASITAFLKAQDAKTAAVDLQLKKLADNKDTAIDIYLKAQDAKTTDVDVIVVSRDNKTVSLDSLLRDTDSKSVSLDAYIQKTGLTKTAAIDSLLVGRDTKNVNLDALIKGLGITKEAAVDIFLQVPGITKEAAVDILLVGRDTKTIDIDLLLKKLSDSKTTNIDALLKALAVTKTVSLDMFIAALGITKTAAVDIVLSKTDTKSISLDVLLKSLGVTKTATLDILLKKYDVTQTATIDMYLRDTSIATSDLDVVLKAIDSKTAAVDLMLKGLGITKTADVDILLRDTDTKTVDVRINISQRDTQTVSIDIILVQYGTARKYIVEIHDSDGNLVAILENAHQVSYTQNLNNPHSLRLSIPSDDSKASNITLANEIWLRDYSSGTVVKKFKLSATRDIRK